MAAYRILVVDDDPLSLATVQYQLQQEGYRIDTASTADQAVEKLKARTEEYALAILDYQLGETLGSDLAETVRQLSPKTYVLIYSGDQSRAAMKSSWNAGAVGFIEKGEAPELFVSSVASWCRKYEETFQAVSLSESLTPQTSIISSIGLVGRSAALAALAEKVNRYAPLSESVLILGETGTGKELVAKSLHRKSPNLFFAVNCATYNGPSELLESELFGYLRGAFTGAQKDHAGIFESAAGGTVFLDEVHTLDLKAQQKLLRVLQEKKVRRLGATQELSVNFRLIVAAKPELEQAVADGTFLADLFERLNVLRLVIPPLRERPEDLEPLVAFFCERFEKETGSRKRFLKRTMKYLERYAWPRNVRELENLVRRLCIDTQGEDIAPEHLDPRFFELASSPAPVREKMDQVLRNEVTKVLQGNVSQREAARKLGMPESSFRRLLKKMEMGTGVSP